jgi:tetratricopeptide (TPR) repeat protein
MNAAAILLAAWVATALMAPFARAADARYDTARQSAQIAQDLQAKGQWGEAQTVLARAAQACGGDAAGRACRLLIGYSQGYLNERQARNAPEQARAWLEAAEQHYQAVLAEAPQHEATLKNLALIDRELGRPGDAERLLQRAAETDRSGTGRAALLLGQLYRDAGQFGAALAAFERAAAANPGDAAAPQAIVALYANGPAERLGALMPRLAQWTLTLPSVAEEGYRRILMRVPGTPEAEQGLLPWVQVIARQGWVSASSFAGLPTGWAPLDAVVQFAAQPETQPGPDGWWMDRPLRRSVLGELALAVAQAPAARAEPGRALRRLEVGLRICPGYEEYQFRPELRAAWPTRLELSRAMLSLLGRQPQLDPNGQRQRQLINELFAGKAGAYRSEDLVAMQRFHTTLGRWYAERGEWGPGGITNGRFQLEHAIDTAEQRVKRGEPYQPLQEEKDMLAGGYLKIGAPDQARSMYLQAAAAYLDTDQLEPAQLALANAERIATPTPTADAVQATLLRQVLTTRAALAEGAAAGFEQQAAQRWLGSEDERLFHKRQKFKTLADLALLRSPDSNHEETTARRAGAAFLAALALNSMVGTADLVRLEGVKTWSTVRADVGDRRAAIVATRPATKAGGMAWSLYVPTDSRPVFVRISSDAIVAVRVDAALRSNPALAGHDLRFSVDDGAVKVYLPEATPAMVQAAQGLQDVDGVRMVVVEVM